MVAAQTSQPAGNAFVHVPGTGERVRTALSMFVRSKPLGAFGGAVILILIVVAVFANVLSPYDPLAHQQVDALQGPSWKHWSGTDQFGRDIFSRLLYGARISLYVGVGATLLSILPAIALGISTAYFRGPYDYGVQRVVDAVQALPSLILIITLVVILGTGIWNIIVALSFGRAIAGSRVIRGSSFQVMSSDYVLAARTLGASDRRIMSRHVLPNVVAPAIVLGSLGFGQVILAEASLSFLGLGIQPPAPSWGGMIASEGRAYMYAAPHMLVMPAVALGLVVFGVNMFGDALRDVLDPRLRGSS